MEEDEEVEVEEKGERKRMRKNTCDVLCLNNLSKCRLAIYVRLTSIEAITFIDTWEINTTLKTNDPISQTASVLMNFGQPFSMVVTGPSGSGKTEWTRKLLLSSLIQPPPERILWCFGQWQPLYDDIQKKIPLKEFVHGLPDYLNSSQYIEDSKRNLLIFDDLMTEAKYDQRIADLFTKGSRHRNISIVYLTQNLFPQGKACRDIALNTQYLVLFNNPIDKQQVATLARRIYPSTSAIFVKRFE